MMLYAFYIKLLFLLAIAPNYGGLSTEKSSSFFHNDSIKHKVTARKLDLLSREAFKDGEILTFKIRYGFIKAGTAKMKVFEDTYNNIPVYHLQTTAKSVSTFNWIYEVNDVVNSYVDYKSFFPIRFEKKLREGGYRADLFTDYLHSDSLAHVEFIRYTSDMEIKKRQKYDVSIPAYVQDILSSFYYIRTQELEVGRSLFLSNHEKRKIYDLEIKVLQREIIEVEAGKFLCVVVEPVIQGEGLFKKKGNLKIWLTDDDKKIPVQMKSEVLVGSITTELIKIEGVKELISAQIR